MHSPIIEIQNISKSFYPALSFRDILTLKFTQKQKIEALNNVSFCLAKGSVTGILGPNGAGKTTLLKTISTLILPDAGEIIIDSRLRVGEDDEKIKSMIGFVSSQERSFYWRLTGRQNLEFFSSLYGLNKKETSARVEYLFRLFEIEYADKRFDTYSSGMKQKLSLVRALLQDPEILLLDEPTKSLDITTAINLHSFIKNKLSVEQKKTIVYTTHSIQEAQSLGDSYIIMDRGEIKAEGNTEGLRKKINKPQASFEEIFLHLCSQK